MHVVKNKMLWQIYAPRLRAQRYFFTRFEAFPFVLDSVDVPARD